MDLSTQTLKHSNTVIIGAGIAGLTAAWRLQEAGIHATVLEQSSNVGGCVRTMHEDGYLLELGPNTFLNSSTKLWDLAESVGLAELKVETPKKIGKKRYIFKNDRLKAVPAGPNILFSSLLSLAGRLRLLKEPFIKPLSQTLKHLNTQTLIYDESLASFITRRLGREVLDTLVTPFVSGIYAGDPEKLSLKAVFPKLIAIEQEHGSIFRGMKALKSDIKSSGLGSFRAGIGTLPMAIESRLKNAVVKNARVVSVVKLSSGYDIRYELNEEIKNIVAKTVIAALPSYSAARIFSDISSELKDTLSQIEYAPIIVVHTGFKKDKIPLKLDGFGFLVPRKNRVRILGSLWSSALFPDRASDGNTLLTNFIGGMLDQKAINLTNEDIMRIVQKDLTRTLKIKAAPNFACITRYTHAIPQYHIGHVKKIAKITNSLTNIPGLFLTGSYFAGPSAAETIEHADKTTQEAIKYVYEKV